MKRCWIVVLFLFGCTHGEQVTHLSSGIPIIFDTDANNELDDQHALAYLLFSEGFDVLGVTVNATYNGGSIESHVEEARRVMDLCNAGAPLLTGADSNFETIRQNLNSDTYDGKEAVDFIASEAMKERDQRLVLLPVGKLTNIALALEKHPEIKEKVRIVWLGSNYPAPGEYNLENDIPALNYILEQEVPFEMVMVRYGSPSGSDAVRATPEDIARHLAGKGPPTEPVVGRHGGSFTTFGDYSVSLFENATLHGDPPSRALFDMVAVAIVKNPTWGEKKDIPAPQLVNKHWKERPQNDHLISVWENFNREAILEDFYTTFASEVK